MEADSSRLCQGIPGSSPLAGLLPLAQDLDSTGLRRLWLVEMALAAGCDVCNLFDVVVRLENFITGAERARTSAFG